MDNSPKGVLKALESRFPWITNLISEKTLLWILEIFLIVASFFKDIPTGSVAVMALGIILITYALIDPKTIKKLTSQWISWERYEYNKEERQTAVQAGQKEIPPEIKEKLDQIAEDAKRRKDDERAPEDYLVLAGEAWEEKKYEDGLRLAYSGLNLDPQDSRTRAGLYNVLGVIYINLQVYSLAEENCHKAIQTDQKFFLFHYNLGVFYSDQKKYAEAEAPYQKALELDPNYAPAHNNLGSIYLDQKKYSEAEMEYQKALESDPGYISAYYNVGTLYSNQKRYEEAEVAFKKALELDPKYAAANNNLGNLFLNQKKYPEAEAAYQKSLELDPNKAITQNNLGCLYIELNRLPEAGDHITRALKLDSTNPVFHVSLGELFMKQGKLEEAEVVLNKALELNPDYEVAQENLEKVRKMRAEDEDSPDRPTLDKGKAKSKKFPK